MPSLMLNEVQAEVGLSFDRDLRMFEDCLKRAKIPKHVIKRALAIYREARKGVNDTLLKHSLKAVALLKAARELRYPLSFGEALKLFPRARAKLLEAAILVGLPRAGPSLYIPRACSRLVSNSELKDRMVVKAFTQLSKLSRTRNSLKPQTLTAVAIYLACKELGLEFPLWRIAYASGIEESTLRKALKLFGLKDLMPKARARRGGPERGDH